MLLVEDKMWDVDKYKTLPVTTPLAKLVSKPVCEESGRHLEMDKNAVTRTFSIGAIGSGTKASDDFSTERQHSNAGMRALLWATSSAKSLGCSTDSQTSRENIFPNILTPDSIPQFTIPSLSVQTSLRTLDKETEGNDEGSQGGLGSPGTELESSVSPATISSSASSTGFTGLVVSDRRAERTFSDPLTKRRSLLQREMHYSCFSKEAQHCLDPASKAALSLPHLTKVTTPYGFVTLSQSPQRASEEALLCQAGLRRSNIDDETSCKSAGTNAKSIKGASSQLSGAKKKLSKDSTNSQTKGRLVRGESQASSASASNAPAASVSSSSIPRHPDAKLKRRFYEVIRKHFISRH